MDDPFSTLLTSLQTLFAWEAMRNNIYTNPSVQQLKEATVNYNPQHRQSVMNLLEATVMCSPRMKIWRVNVDTVGQCVDHLARAHDIPTVDWFDGPIKHHDSFKRKGTPKSLVSQEINLVSWLSKKSGKPYEQLTPKEVTRLLLKHLKETEGFTQMLSEHLERHPDFLFELINDSERNFTKLCKSRLILYLTDQQIAKAIVKHIPALVHKKSDPFAQVTELVQTLNGILSYGRSVSTLLRNAEAKPVLLNSPFFQVYQSDTYF